MLPKGIYSKLSKPSGKFKICKISFKVFWQITWIAITIKRKEETVEKVKHGDTVKIHYTGKLEDGTIFDTSAKRDPLQFIIGAGQVISGFEEAVVGMNPSESKTVKVPADKAYGPHREEMVLVVDRN